jgi:hypothetical protein
MCLILIRLLVKLAHTTGAQARAASAKSRSCLGVLSKPATGHCERLGTVSAANPCLYLGNDKEEDGLNDTGKCNHCQRSKGDAEAAIDGVRPQWWEWPIRAGCGKTSRAL